MAHRVRKAAPADLARIAEIYNQGITGRGATFETEPRDVSDIAGWLDGSQLLVVAEVGGDVAAFARTSGYRDRACYAGIREFSIYTDERYHGQGLALATMQLLIDEARGAGLSKLVSRIFEENTASLALCERLSFRQVGIYEKHGMLEGEWRDCVIVELLLMV